MTDPWHSLRRYTQARIAQGRVGCGLPTTALLDFQMAHAAARDAVHQPWDASAFAQSLERLGLTTLQLKTAVADRVEYLQRPDKGRCLDAASADLLVAQSYPPVDVALLVSNGLSSTALDAHGLPLLTALIDLLQSAGLTLGPICLIPNARVAVADEVGALLNARLSIILIGERPGLSAADSIGAYLTYGPRIGNTDAERNCLSNIRPPAGLSYQAAADKLLYLSSQALLKGYSGVALKDDMPNLGLLE